MSDRPTRRWGRRSLRRRDGSRRPSAAERVAVIGAGAGGICAARHLLERGIDVTVLELGSHVGGLWVYDNDNGRSPAYRSLHINSEARVTQYPDFPFPEGTPLFPSHEQVHAYLGAYANHHDVTPHIRFNCRVVAVEPSPSHRPQWRVRLADGSEEVYDGVVVASGHQGVPSHPPFADRFDGEYLHSQAYRVPEPFRDRDVLVVGTGNSALDIAADVCGVAASTTLCARSPVLIMPRMMFGVPTARVLGRIEKRWMPWRVRRALRVLVAHVAHGRMEQWGFTTPDRPTHPAGHPSIMSHIAYDRIKVRPAITSVEGTTIEFADGDRREYDAVIAATGYEVDLPFLSPDIVCTEDRRVDLYKRVLAPGWPGLYFVGFFNVSGGANIRMMDVQARWVAALAAGDTAAPDEGTMRSWIAEERRALEVTYPDSPRYGLELDPRSYPREVAAEHP